jgi:XTP/dITP diphosphohydrolase
MDSKINELVFVTSNKNKIIEIQHKIGNQFSLKNLSDIGFHEDISEPFDTIQENAICKAKYIHDRFHIHCFAEDSGLVIEALNGEPGVLSARYAGEQKNDADNIELVLKKMKNIENRHAYFITVIALILNNQLFTFEGKVFGNITHEIIGSGGFGYDPIFQPNGYNHTFAELGIEVKNKISHRAKAVEQLIQFLKKEYSNT